MEFDVTTFALEILNFLVLVWLLKHFFYAPVLRVLDARQTLVQAETDRAAQLQRDAQALKSQYEGRVAEWQQEREQSRRDLQQELAQLRSSGMEALRHTLADEEAKAHARAAAASASREAELVRQALSEAYGNVAAMLQRLASPELTAALVLMLEQDLMNLPEQEAATLRTAAQALDGSVQVSSAHPLDEAASARLTTALSSVCGRPLQLGFSTDAALIAGLRVALGSSLLHANLADELAFFQRRGAHG